MRINDENYKEFLLRYMEEDLTAEELAEVDGFIDEEPVAIQELRALERTKAKPDLNIVFPHKNSLKKKETEVPVRKLMWYTTRAASIAAMFIVVILFYNEFAGNQQAQGMYYLPQDVSSAVNGLQDEDIAGETETVYYYNNENEGLYSEINQVAGVVPVTTFKNTGNIPSLIKKEINTESNAADLKTSKGRDANVVSYQNKNEEKLAEVSRVQVQTALKLLKNKTVAYTEASQFHNSAAEFTTDYPTIRKISGKIVSANVNEELASAENEKEIENPTLISAINNIFRKNISIKKKQHNDHKYYALTLETSAIKISRKFKAAN